MSVTSLIEVGGIPLEMQSAIKSVCRPFLSLSAKSLEFAVRKIIPQLEEPQIRN